MASLYRLVSLFVGLLLYGAIVICLHSKLMKSTMNSRLLSSAIEKESPVVGFSLKLLENVSSKEDLEHTTSPQHKAARWMAVIDKVQASSESQLLTRYALACLYFALKPKGEFPARFGEMSECSWEGIECGLKNELHAIKMNGRGLTGTIPSEVRIFSSLKTLDLSENKIQGKIPKEVWNLEELQSLFLYKNRLKGPALHPEMGKLANLNSLYLGSNKLTGSFPEAMLGSNRSMKSLRKFYIIYF